MTGDPKIPPLKDAEPLRLVVVNDIAYWSEPDGTPIVAFNIWTDSHVDWPELSAKSCCEARDE